MVTKSTPANGVNSITVNGEHLKPHSDACAHLLIGVKSIRVNGEHLKPHIDAPFITVSRMVYLQVHTA